MSQMRRLRNGEGITTNYPMCSKEHQVPHPSLIVNCQAICTSQMPVRCLLIIWTLEKFRNGKMFVITLVFTGLVAHLMTLERMTLLAGLSWKKSGMKQMSSCSSVGLPE